VVLREAGDGGSEVLEPAGESARSTARETVSPALSRRPCRGPAPQALSELADVPLMADQDAGQDGAEVRWL